MNFDIDVGLPESVDARTATAYVGLSRPSLRRPTKAGIIPAFCVPSRSPGRFFVRYRLNDLDRFCENYKVHSRSWNPSVHKELPARLAGVLLDVDEKTVHQLKFRRALKSYEVGEIRRYMRRQILRGLKWELKTENQRLKRELRRLRQAVGGTQNPTEILQSIDKISGLVLKEG